MSRQIQIRRGTATQHNNFTGAIGEVTMDTTNKTLRVHDGSTLGGNEIMSVNKFWSYATNCVVEISQDIQVSYSGTTLTIKKDSKLYYPNGTGVFDNVVLSADETCSARSESGTYFVFRRQVGTGYFSELVPYIKSGIPDSSTHGLFYDTSNNRIDWYEHGTKVDRLYSFPICKITVSGGAIVSIDQVFNGFGFIGSSVYILPGVKGMAPNGKNEDGTLKNELCMISNVRVVNNVNSITGYTFGIRHIGGLASFYGKECVQEEYPGTNYRCWYKLSENKIYNTKTAQGSEIQDVCVTLFYVNTTTYTFEPKTVFHPVDYNDTDWVANQAMPSQRYTDLTLGASGTTYTAPANGYFTVTKQSQSAGEWLFFINETTNINVGMYPVNQTNGRMCFSVSKGDVIKIHYTLSGNTSVFRFVYANGAK